MEKKINIAEILADCPKGMELYSPIFGKVYLNKIRPHLAIVVTTDKEQGDFKEEFLYDGRYGMNGECCIFPSKDQRDWSTFQRPFIDGDVISNGKTIAIFKKADKPYIYFQKDVVYYHCWYNHRYDEFKAEIDFGIGYVEEFKYATEEEKQELLQAIKDNGYRWDTETKTLEKLPELKDGDIIYVDFGDYNVTGILKKLHKEFCYFYVCLNKCGELQIPILNDNKVVYCTSYAKEITFATEEQNKKLFKEIKDNGYKWNAETKTLEKLIEPKFKVGDRVKKNTDYISGIVTDIFNDSFKVTYDGGCFLYVQFHCQSDWELVKENIQPKFKVGDKIVKKNGISVPVEITSVGDEFYYSNTYNGVGVLPIKDQDDWELVVEPKFKIGDRIKSTISSSLYTVVDIKDETYYIKNDGEKYPYPISFSQENLYELVTDKFDITSLKPFESKVLVRDSANSIHEYDEEHTDVWRPAIWGVYVKDNLYPFGVQGGCYFNYCIPYEGNEHLLGTTNDCDEFYKNW